MKTQLSVLKAFAILLIVFCFTYTGCKDEVTKTVTYHTQTPYFLSVADLRKMTVAKESPRTINVTGKIYIYNDYLFINEPNKGIHIINNANPASPKFVSFINIPGNMDMAVNNNMLYADSYIDLVAFDISNPNDVKLIKRLEDVFESYYINKDKGLVLGYKDTVITYSYKEGENNFYTTFDASYAFSSSGGKSSYGTGGSTARFTLLNNTLFTVDHYNLKAFDVVDEKNPKFSTNTQLGFGIETIFPYDDKLFIGSTTGMHIYDAKNPLNPQKLSTYQHITSCDPVVVQGNYAYVTLRSGTMCRQGSNLLQVLNVEDAANPKLVSSFQMLNPHGLSVSGNNLFICEGSYGLKAFNSNNPIQIGENQIAFLKSINAVDVIAGPKSLIVTGNDGVYQFDYTQASALKQLSHIKIDSDYQ